MSKSLKNEKIFKAEELESRLEMATINGTGVGVGTGGEDISEANSGCESSNDGCQTNKECGW